VQPGFGFNKAGEDSDYTMLSPLSNSMSIKCGNTSSSRVYLTDTKTSFPFKNSTHDHLNAPVYKSDRKAMQGFKDNEFMRSHDIDQDLSQDK
jgi:hypothetical protein